MQTLIYIIIGIVVGGGLVAFFLVVLKKGKQKDEDKSSDQGLLLLQQQMENLTQTIDAKLGSSQKDMGDAMRHQFDASQKLIKEIDDRVNKHMISLTKEMGDTNASQKQFVSIAEGLHDLKEVLQNQKRRGNLGEAGLELVLGNILPPTAYKMQYSFKDGDTVDAIITTKEGIIPVDAKFSLENYTRIGKEQDADKKIALEKEFKNDLKKRIDETAKYIKPKEGTLPFAFMFIPAEAIYYDLLVNNIGTTDANSRTLLDYAYNDKNVIIVSPTTFTAYLQSVLYGFKAFKIEESAKIIGKRVEELRRHIGAYEQYYSKLGNSLKTTVNHYNAGYKELGKIDKDVVKITGESAGVEPLVIEKPEVE